MAPSIFSATLGVSPLAGSLLRLSAVGSLAIIAARLGFARQTVGGLADQPLSAVTAPAKENKLSFYQNTSWFLVGAVLQLTWSFRGIPSVLDKAAFILVGLQLAAGGIGEYRIGYTGPAFAFAGSLLPMLGALAD